MKLDVRKDFPLLKNNESIFFDNSSTTLKPQSVIDVILDSNINAINSSRGTSKVVRKRNNEIEGVRSKVANLINASSPEEIVFTKGSTESSNLIAYSYCLNNLSESDELLVCFDDHKSTVLPYVNVNKNNFKIKEILMDYDAGYKKDELLKSLNENTKMIILTHIHNFLCVEMEIKDIVKMVREVNKDCIFVLDASQSIGHINVDVQDLDVDILYFSGHKMLASEGVGCLYIKENLINKFHPFIIGGNYNKNEISNIHNIRELECGTRNNSAILSLGSAIDYINNIGIGNIECYISELTRYLYSSLNDMPLIRLKKEISYCACELLHGMITFEIEGINSSEMGDVLEDYNIYVRTGDFCNTSINENFIRVSMYIYNTKEEVDRFIEVLKFLLK